jgi:hypothetical protein
MFLIRLIFIVTCFNSISQVHNLEIIPDQKIDQNNLKTLITNDGKELIILDTSQLIGWRSNSIYSKKAAVIKLNNNEFLYNYYAVNSNRLCPIGKHIISFDDIQKVSKSDYKVYNFNKYVSYIDIEGSCESKKISYEINPDKIIGVYSTSTLKNPDDSKYQAAVYLSGGSFTSFLYEINDFLPTRCVEDILYSFQNTEYSLNDLKPNYFKNYKDLISKEILFKSNTNKEIFGTGIVNIAFDHFGNFNSSFVSNENLSFWNVLKPIFEKKEIIVAPYYEKYFIATKDLLKINIVKNAYNIDRKRIRSESPDIENLFKNKVDNLNFPIFYRFYTRKLNTIQNLARFKKLPFENTIYVNNEKQFTPTYYLSKIHISGSGTPLKSLIFPGLGSKSLNFNKLHKIHQNLAFATLISLVSSFSISQLCYQKYISNLKQEPYGVNYGIANISHKISLISLGLYPVISISDILSCYLACKINGIGLFGNKRMQNLINKELRQNKINSKYLCLD